jgi:hypothetical protein
MNTIVKIAAKTLKNWFAFLTRKTSCQSARDANRKKPASVCQQLQLSTQVKPKAAAAAPAQGRSVEEVSPYQTGGLERINLNAQYQEPRS